jgi:hypothetical protein
MRQPGQWTGTKWVCPGQPADKVKKYFYCCPEGYKSIGRDAVQAAGTGWQNIKTSRMVCSAGSKIMSCGPKPAGDVVCCHQLHQWRPNKGPNSCPMAEMGSGSDAAFLARLQLQTDAQGADQGALGRRLGMIGVPFLIATAIFMYFILR